MDLEELFSGLGGTFVAPAGDIIAHLPLIKAIIFDWDGVFNNGMKSGESGSPFSEIDSMGINLLRFSWWLKTGEVLGSYIITGMNNQTALTFARREHFDGIFMNQKNKRLALDAICGMRKIKPGEAIFVFDDVIDIELAILCGLSFFISRRSNPLLNSYIQKHKIASYISAFSGGDNGVREICELITGLNGNFERTFEMRSTFTPEYENYLNTRNAINTKTEA
jgi:3-deoxy-D-manno-octulosonate 8-phosphate phosphatase (KDO 8-P phosphatase)